jgi:hypothetical protein
MLCLKICTSIDDNQDYLIPCLKGINCYQQLVANILTNTPIRQMQEKEKVHLIFHIQSIMLYPHCTIPSPKILKFSMLCLKICTSIDDNQDYLIPCLKGINCYQQLVANILGNLKGALYLKRRYIL